jgi:hypothetical protein
MGEFRIRSAWPFYVLAGVATLYFVLVVYLAANPVSGLDLDVLALAGLVFFAILIVLAFLFMGRRKLPRPPPAANEPALLREDMQDEPLESEAPRMAAQAWNDELVRTTEQQQGLTVLEYSRPPKSQHRGAVYAKAYVPVTKEFVLRIEVLVADGADL